MASDVPEPAIRVHGARTHNLRDLDVALPRGAWTVVCGVSGSGKSSLVLDTLGAESRRRFLGTQRRARFDGGGLPRPDVDRIEGLPPAVTAGFSGRRPGVRATLGTVTEVSHDLRALFMRAAVPHCPTCGKALAATTREAATAELLALPAGTRLVLLAPRGHGPEALAAVAREGFVRVRLDGGAPRRLEDLEEGACAPDARVDAVIDRLVVKPDAGDRFAASVEQAFELGGGRMLVQRQEAGGAPAERAYADRPWCARCDRPYPPLGTALFSFDSPQGACPTCEGRGGEDAPCPDCGDARLNPFARAARLAGESLPALEARPAAELAAWLQALELPPPLDALTTPAREDALARLGFLVQVGLGYLAPARRAATLSSGELRRARLAAACAARMSGLLYLLDEPTAGLHPADRPPLSARLRALVEEGNTVVCVEHDLQLLRAADWMLELGPGAGVHGGALLASGPAEKVLAEGRTPAARALARTPPPPRKAPRSSSAWVRVRGARRHNLRDVTCRFPAVGLTAVTGVSGAGKSTLALEVISPAAQAALAGAPLPAGTLRALEGMEGFARVVPAASSAPRHPRATAGGVLRVLPPLRALFAATLEARARGWAPVWFSLHVPGGRCSACKGTGRRTVLLRDLPEHRVTCDACGGRRYRPEVERVRVKGFSFADVLELSLAEAAEAFRDLPRVHRPLRAAADVGLGYVPLGEATSRLSGGEALRLRLASALGRGGRRDTLYVLDEPCAGLHPDDVAHLVEVLLRLGARGNAVLVVEHHLDLVRHADHVIELGPGPGAAGGRLVYEGPPAGLAACEGAATAPWLRSG